jgi:hypothetical protein
MPYADGSAWLGAIETDAPDVVAGWRALEPNYSGLRALRRELRARVHDEDAPRILAQQEVIGDALEAILRDLPDELLRAPGGEDDWNVAHAFVHRYTSRPRTGR